jgi:thioredoxin-like negative regulator of GroEL
MIERLIVFSVVVVLLLLVYAVLRRWQVLRVARFSGVDPLLTDLRPGTPAIIYFKSPLCAPCQMRQKPALHALQTALENGVQVIEVDALEQPEVAMRWGVLSVPTTFVLDSSGRPRNVNHGVAGTEKLKRQLQRAV